MESLFQDLIEANTAIMTLLTGGIYTFAELGPSGLVKSNPVCASAFTTSNGISVIKPCGVIRVRVETPNAFRSDSNTREAAFDGVVEFWLYQDKNYDVINSVSVKISRLLRLRAFSGIGLVQSAGSLSNLVAPEFQNVSLRRDDYRFKYVDRGS